MHLQCTHTPSIVTISLACLFASATDGMQRAMSQMSASVNERELALLQLSRPNVYCTSLLVLVWARVPAIEWPLWAKQWQCLWSSKFVYSLAHTVLAH